MSYPSSCGTDGTVTEISLECLNDIWKTTGNECKTTFEPTEDPNYFTLAGSTFFSFPFSTYGQSLSSVFTNISAGQNEDKLCQGSSNINPATITSVNDALIFLNNEINGFTAQYTLLYNQHFNLLNQPPATIANAKQALLVANALKLEAPTVVNTASAQAAQALVTELTTNYKANIAAIQADIEILYQIIMGFSTSVDNMLQTSVSEGDNNRDKIRENTTILMEQVEKMNAALHDLNENNISDKIKLLDGVYEEEDLKTNSNFIKNMLYILFALFIIGCLVMIHLNPTEGKLDMFIMALGVIILVYYIYNYFQTRMMK